MLTTSLGSDLPRIIIVEDVADFSLVKKPLLGVHSIQVGPSWMDPLVTFLVQGLYSRIRARRRKYIGRPPTIGYPKSKICIVILI